MTTPWTTPGYYAGPYNVTAQRQGQSVAVDIGTLESGVRIIRHKYGNAISPDVHGKVAVDGIGLGSQPEIELIGLQYSEDGFLAAFPEGHGEGTVGKLWSATAVKLVLTPVLGVGFFKFTCWKAVCMEDVEMMLAANDLLRLPMRFLLLPDYTQPAAADVFYKKELVTS